MNFPHSPKRALTVLLSNTVDIPQPFNLAVSGAATTTSAGELVATGLFPASLEIAPGDILYNTSDNSSALVTGRTDDDTLTLSANIMASGENFSLYRKPDSNEGCWLWVSSNGSGSGSAIDIVVLTAGGDQVEFADWSQSGVLPVRVKRVFATGTTISTPGQIIALW